MKHYIGIGQEKRARWNYITLFFYNSMITIALWTPKTKFMKFYYYKKIEYDYSMTNEIFTIGWFFGLVLNK